MKTSSSPDFNNIRGNAVVGYNGLVLNCIIYFLWDVERPFISSKMSLTQFMRPLNEVSNISELKVKYSMLRRIADGSFGMVYQMQNKEIL